MRSLDNDEITKLLRPLSHGVGKPFYIDSSGNKHYVDKLSSVAVGGFINKGPDGRRIFMAGNPDVVAYKE